MMTTETTQPAEPTAEQFTAYQAMFRHFNVELFGGDLPEPLLNLSRGPQKAVAFFAPKRWQRTSMKGDGRTTHEISLNPRFLGRGKPAETAQDLVHEMCHLWQHVFGKPSRPGYHDREWSKKMIEVGLQPIDVKTGQSAMSAHSMSDRVIAGGRFERVVQTLPPAALLPWMCLEASFRPSKPSQPQNVAGDEEPTEEQAPKPKNKHKYTCPECHANAWGKPGLQLACMAHDEPVMFALAH